MQQLASGSPGLPDSKDREAGVQNSPGIQFAADTFQLLLLFEDELILNRKLTEF